MATEKQVGAVLRQLCVFGLRLRPEDLASSERKRQKDTIRALLHEQEPQELLDAIEYGMPNIWPFAESAQPFDAYDLRRHLVKALGEAGRRRRRGSVPFNAQNWKGPGE